MDKIGLNYIVIVPIDSIYYGYYYAMFVIYIITSLNKANNMIKLFQCLVRSHYVSFPDKCLVQ